MAKKHPDVPIPGNLNTGKTRCLDCMAQFHRTRDLVIHLESEHKMEFKIETLTFQNLEGRYFIVFDINHSIILKLVNDIVSS